MSQALLDPVAVKTKLIQEGRPSSTQVMHGEWLKRQTLLFSTLHDRHRYAVERSPRHGSVRVIARRQRITRVGCAGLECNQDVQRLPGEIDIVWFAALHSLLRNAPDCIFKIHLIPCCI